MTEKEFDHILFNTTNGVSMQLGWTLNYHTLRSKGSQPGFPDRVLVRERIIYAELKSDEGKPTDRQRAWLCGLAKAGAEVYLLKPPDLTDFSKVLAGRWKFDGALNLVRNGVLEVWFPNCLWLAEGRRVDQ